MALPGCTAKDHIFHEWEESSESPFSCISIKKEPWHLKSHIPWAGLLRMSFWFIGFCQGRCNSQKQIGSWTTYYQKLWQMLCTDYKWAKEKLGKVYCNLYTTLQSVSAHWSCGAIHTVTGGETTNRAGVIVEKMVRQIQDFKNGSVTRMKGAGLGV